MDAKAIRALFEDVLQQLFDTWMAAPEDGYEASLPTLRCDRLEDQLAPYRARLDALLSSDWHKWPEERPPEAGEEYIVAVAPYEPYGLKGFVTTMPFQDGKWWEEDHGDSGLIETNAEVTHWRPLPDPPEAQP